MNMVNKSLDTYSSSEQIVHTPQVIVDERFVPEKNKQKRPYRTIVILSLMALSILFFLYDSFTNTMEEEVSVKEEAVSIGSVLVDKPYGYETNEVNDKAPDSVLDFIGAYHFIPDKVEKNDEDKVVLYEIIDEVDNSEKIDFFLKEASALLKADKLTLPKGNNAFERYEAVLALDADNAVALEGISKIVNRYVSLAEKVIKKKEEYKVAGLIKSAYLVGEKYQDMTPIMAKYNVYIEDPTVFINIPVNNSDKEEIIEKEALSIQKSIKDVDRDIALAASKLLESNNVIGAVNVLKRFTEISDYWGQSYDLLLTIYLSDVNIKEAEALISSNSSLDTFQLAEKVSRLFIASNDIAGALNLLNSHSPDIIKYNEFYALKAGLYHDNGDYEKAIDLYRKLISIDYDNSRYWLGLAVSLDAIGDTQALEAFQYAYQYSSANPTVKDYIEQRILVLSK